MLWTYMLLLEQFLHFLHAALPQQGSWQMVSKAVETVALQGTGAVRQRKVYQQTDSLQQVVAFIVKETARGTI